VTKAAVVSLSETLSAELKEFGVGVTVLCPTFFQTNILASSRRTSPADGLEGVIADRMAQSKLQADGVARAGEQASLNVGHVRSRADKRRCPSLAFALRATERR